ncbi:diguanylate cyclase domain-containing protein [Roseateles amylovorans]|uniref:Diguanylate cyclase n=1 Tax=Roseateles amylovorans TaxID=2978473 RepID=A0ABY6B393_9BURK|nr:diguanylate cyclase [Roseateles amylovorans]UXH77750.1 diguanylate cyclase [Roseateles amylovorans]
MIPLTWTRPGRMATWLILGNLLLIATLVVMTGLSLNNHRLSEEKRARDVVDNLAQSLSVEVGAELRNADNALSTIGLRYRSARLTADHQDALVRMLEEQRDLLPQVSVLRIADVRGQVVAGLSADERSFNVADRAYFTEAMMSTDMVISEPLQGRVNGEWSLILARRLINHDGQFAGVVFAVVTARHFLARFSQVALGPSGAVSLRSESMNLIARYSAGEPRSTKGFGGRQLSAQLQRSLAQNRDHGVYLTPTVIDQVERITAYRKVPGYSLTLFTGMGSGDFLASWRKQAWQQAMLTALVALAVAGASAMIHRTHQGERRSRKALARLAGEQDAMLQNDLVGMVRVFEGRALWCNPALEQMFGYEPGELTQSETRVLFMDDADHAHISHVGSSTIRAGERFRTQLRMRRKDGSAFWVDVSGMVLSDTDSLWTLADIDGLKQSEARAQDLALRDALTQLPNRRFFEERVGDAIHQARRTGQDFAVCYLDLDGFKPVNDQYGHNAGDEVLVQIAQRLQGLVRANDVVARLGGDEFAILLSGVSRATDVEQLLQRFLFSIQRRITLDAGERVSVNASMGAVIGGGDDVCAELLRLADEAMYGVKRTGKGRLQVVSVDDPAWAVAA